MLQSKNNYLPASSEGPTRQGLLAVITSEHTPSRSREVNKHSLPPNEQNRENYNTWVCIDMEFFLKC